MAHKRKGQLTPAPQWWKHLRDWKRVANKRERRAEKAEINKGRGQVNFVAIDVETANPDMSSICQIGLVKYENSVLVDEWKSYVDPESYFNGVNVSIHGIDESIVRGAPKFPELWGTLRSYLEGNVVVCHTYFDRVALYRAATRYGITPPAITWLDSARIAKRTWKECAYSGYGLRNVCKMLGYNFDHHDALEDAKAAAHIVLTAVNETGLDIEGFKQAQQLIDLSTVSSGAPNSRPKISREGNPDGALHGEVLVFTGALTIPRREAADIAASIGCRVASGVTSKTTMLVVGDQDITKLAGHEESSKLRKAKDLIKKGSPIRILTESDFIELVRMSNDNPAKPNK